MEKRNGEGESTYVWKKIVEVFVRVQEPEYYDRILLLVVAKYAEIVKVGETIKDGLKTGKITCVAA